MTKSMDDRVLDLVAGGTDDVDRVLNILKAESWPWAMTASPVDFRDWLRGHGYSVDEVTRKITV